MPLGELPMGPAEWDENSRYDPPLEVSLSILLSLFIYQSTSTRLYASTSLTDSLEITMLLY